MRRTLTLCLLTTGLVCLPACGLIYGTAAATATGVAAGGVLIYKVTETTVKATTRVLTAPVRFVRKRNDDMEARRARFRYEKNRHIAEHQESVEVIWLAARDTLVHMGLANVDGTYDDMGGSLRAYTHAGDRVRIEIEALDDDRTELRIGIGKEGDPGKARLIHKRIVEQFALDVQSK